MCSELSGKFLFKNLCCILCCISTLWNSLRDPQVKETKQSEMCQWCWWPCSRWLASDVALIGCLLLSQLKWKDGSHTTTSNLYDLSRSSLHTCQILYKVSKKIKQNTEKSSTWLKFFILNTPPPTLPLKFRSIGTCFWRMRHQNTCHHCGRECWSMKMIQWFL